jgi:RNA polymerase sigma factor (sigma-70 family)
VRQSAYVAGVSKRLLLTHNARLVYKLAQRFAQKGGRGRAALDDLFTAGVAGLEHAIDKFDLGRNGALSTYAYHWILQSMQRNEEAHATVLGVPVHIRDLSKRLRFYLFTAQQERRLGQEAALQVGLPLLPAAARGGAPPWHRACTCRRPPPPPRLPAIARCGALTPAACLPAPAFRAGVPRADGRAAGAAAAGAVRHQPAPVAAEHGAADDLARGRGGRQRRRHDVDAVDCRGGHGRRGGRWGCCCLAAATLGAAAAWRLLLLSGGCCCWGAAGALSGKRGGRR